MTSALRNVGTSAHASGLTPPPWFIKGCTEISSALTRTWATMMARSVRVEGRGENFADGARDGAARTFPADVHIHAFDTPSALLPN